MQGRKLAYKKLEYSKHTKEKTTHIVFYLELWQEKDNFTLENILLYNPQRNKALSISKKKIKNGGTGSEPNPKKIGFKYIEFKVII
jgi:hypothetical protein